jgi:transcriptional regulator with XRE-family HTH domain
MDRGLGQEQAARVLGIGKTTIVNWEMGHAEGVALWHLPRVVAFLGYDPTPEPVTFGERIRAVRRRQGLSQEALAERLGLDASTVRLWELGRVRKPSPRVRRLFEEFVKGV